MESEALRIKGELRGIISNLKCQKVYDQRHDLINKTISQLNGLMATCDMIEAQEKCYSDTFEYLKAENERLRKESYQKKQEEYFKEMAAEESVMDDEYYWENAPY